MISIRLRALRAAQLYFIVATLVPPGVLWAAAIADPHAVHNPGLPSVPYLMHHMGLDRVPQTFTVFGTLLSVAFWSLAHAYGIYTCARKDDYSSFREETGLHLVMLLFWAGPATLLLNQTGFMPPLAYATQALTLLAILGILLRLLTVQNDDDDPESTLFAIALRNIRRHSPYVPSILKKGDPQT